MKYDNKRKPLKKNLQGLSFIIRLCLALITYNSSLACLSFYSHLVQDVHTYAGGGVTAIVEEVLHGDHTG